MTTAAIYACVSTRDKGQTNDNQLLELRAFAERLGYAVYQEYGDWEAAPPSALRSSNSFWMPTSGASR